MGHFLIVGTGRSGSGYCARLLSAMGIPTGHERVYNETGIHEWGDLCGESSWLAVPFVGEFEGPVIHVVRDPRDVVGSLLKIGFYDDDSESVEQHDLFRRFTREHFPEIWQSDIPLERGAQHWLSMTTAAQSRADATFRLEYLDPIALRFATRINTAPPVTLAGIRAQQGTYSNQQDPINWNDLPLRVVRAAKKYGYL